MSPYPTPTKPNHAFRKLLGSCLLILIVVLAFWVRIWHIDSIPGGLYPDEAVNGIDALQAIETGHYALFYPNNYGREGLFINLQALAVKHFGNTIPVLKLWSVIFGTLAVIGIYLLGKELFQRRAAGLIAAFLLATSYWAINFSRIGFRAIMVTFILTFAFYFFFKGLRTERVRTFLIAGLIFGIGLHTYVAYRLTPLILIALLPFLMLSYEHFLRRFWKHGLAFIFGALLSAAPLLIHFAQHTEEISSRTGAVSIFSPDINHGNFWGTFAKTFGLSLIKYNFWGDQNWRHNYPPYPILDPFTGVFFLTALAYSIYQLTLLIGQRWRAGTRDPAIVRTAFLLIAFFVMLMPEFLTEEGLPHALRSIGTQMPVFLLATTTVLWLIKRAKQSHPGNRLAILSLVFLALFGGATLNVAKYFFFFGQSTVQMGAFDKEFRNMAEYLAALPADTKKYIVTNAGGKMIDNGLPVSAQPIVFLTHGQVDNVIFLQDDTVLRLGEHNVIILMHHDDTLVQKIESKIPGATQAVVDLYPGTDSEFTVIQLP